MNIKTTLIILISFFPFFISGQNDSLSNNDHSKHTQANNAEAKITKAEFGAVVLKSDTLFLIKTPNGNLNPKERAASISNRIKTISSDFKEDTLIFTLRKGLGFIDLMYNNDLILTITNNDAKIAGVSAMDLAETDLEIIQQAINDQKYNLSSKEWLIRIGYTLLALIGLIIILKLIFWGFRILDKRLSKFDKILLKKRRNIFKYFIPKNTKNIFVFISNASRIIIVIVFLFTYLPLLFSFIPWTQGIVEIFYGYIMHPIKFVFYGFINFIPHLFFILVISYITRYFVRIMKDIAEDIASEKLTVKRFPKDWAKPTEKLFRVIVYAFALILIFPHLPGSDSPAFKGVSIFLGVIFSFGSTSAIANIIAGIVITYMRPYQIGDRIKVVGIVGDVVEKNMLVTRLRTIKNEEVTIPNATIINNHLTNYTSNAKEMGIVLHTNVSIGYDIPWEKVNQLLLRAARNSMLLQRDPKPFVLQKSLDDNYITYELNAYTKQAAKMALIYSDIHKNILNVFDDAGIEILSPKYVASRDGNLSTVPSQKVLTYEIL
jgi:small-conductance mechanosensitive channel